MSLMRQEDLFNQIYFDTNESLSKYIHFKVAQFEDG